MKNAYTFSSQKREQMSGCRIPDSVFSGQTVPQEAAAVSENLKGMQREWPQLLL